MMVEEICDPSKHSMSSMFMTYFKRHPTTRSTNSARPERFSHDIEMSCSSRTRNITKRWPWRPWGSMAFVLCALLMVPLVHPDRIAWLAVHRTAWVGPTLICPPAARRCGAVCSAPRAPRVCAMAMGAADNSVAEEHERAKMLDWVNEQTKGGACKFDDIFQRSKKRINMYLDSGSEDREKAREELGKTIQLSKTLSWVNEKTNRAPSEFDIIVERSKQRLDRYLAGDSSQQNKAEAKQELNKTLNTPNKRITQHDREFDVIVERSRKRIDVEVRRSELRGKREEIVRLQKSLKASRQDAQAYRTEVEAIAAAITGAQRQRAGCSRSHIQDLQDALRASEVTLRGMERAVKVMEEEVETLHTTLCDADAQLEACRIRNELVSERERQLAKLQKHLFQMNSHDEGVPKNEIGMVPPGSVALPAILEYQQHALIVGMETLVEQGVGHHFTLVEGKQQGQNEQAHSKLRNFLWQRVGLNKHKAAVAAAAMPELASGVEVEDLEATVLWLEDNVLVSSKRLMSAVEQRPSILLLSIETHLQPVLHFLTTQLSLDTRGVAKVVTANPAILEANVKTVLAPRLAELRAATGVAAAKVGKLVQMHPSVLGEEGLQGLQEHIDFFRKEMGLTKASLGRILATLPGLTCMSVSNQLRPTHEWLLAIGVPPARVERMLVQHPKTLGYSLEKNLKPTVAYLWYEIGARDDKIGRIVSAFPQILGLSVGSNLKPTVAFLVDEVGVPADKMAKIFWTFPQLFGLSLEKTIRPRVDFLSNEVGVPRDKMAKVIFSFPNLLAYNHLDNLRPTVSFLHEDVGIPTERMGKIVATHPQILGYSVEDKLLPTVQYLVEEVGVPEESIGLVVERCPKLLGCSVDNNLRPTVRFLMEEVGMSEKDVGQMVLRYPSLLGLRYAHYVNQDYYI